MNEELDIEVRLVHTGGAPVPAATVEVLEDIAAERFRQIQIHGWSAEHDDRHELAAWGWLLATRAVALSAPFPEDSVSPDPRRQLVEVAAIATAALESWDRNHA